ncbi:ParA family protein [Sphingomonas sp.]|uniref:ParA family protein n=1 Tax=Sphingomonas sp. TaxID=28214 RepID=UPI0028B19CFB|nr:ParA family protein [Sphingomonas sp.]
MATIAVYSLKGGVGKTTLTVNLAWASATRSSRRTLVWDLDPQAASTYLLGGDAAGRHQAQAIFSKDVAAAKLLRATAIDRLALLPADASLRQLDHLFHALDKKKRLSKLLEDLTEDFDRILLDCPPGLTETSEQVMRAADLIVVPVVPSPLSQRAFQEVAAHLAQRGAKVPLMPVHAMVDRRRKLHAEALERQPDWPVIPLASVIESVAVQRAPVGAFAPRSAAAKAFNEMWQAIERMLAERVR